jgi:hypothetical protein
MEAGGNFTRYRHNNGDPPHGRPARRDVVASGADPMLVAHGEDNGPERLRFSAEDASQHRNGHGGAVWLIAF